MGLGLKNLVGFHDFVIYLFYFFISRHNLNQRSKSIICYNLPLLYYNLLVMK